MEAAETQSGSVEKSSHSILSVNSLFCERDDRVLFRDLDFAVNEGQVLQIKGSNGSGKTTLLRILCGLNDAYEGEILWYGEPVEERVEDYFGSLAYIGHRVGVNKVLTPVENLRWTCSLQQVVEDEALYAALAQLGLRGFEDSQCFTLSAGQQQRVSLSRLLVSDARLWILDEPFTTLDASGVKQLEALLREHADRGGAVMVTTHHNLAVSDLQILKLG
ncbi:MAG: cytochrome c biogenesis heme-transporting ATPase CcmA [Gammaproteobacteria bacterium]|nr:cytochrome c biogenesis heme-transporting ATPase CcmA [Gammaproteobacteria bacterium]MDD9894517.1 cytochrome c biogenesis heme-transporting ATPase CcmA [Gammaproteobacteria bacterium]MDD9958202.1 cytochrome c biogenesis heme-transporting ATPase CcmA [Gammaproteobacteria bacterium]